MTEVDNAKRAIDPERMKSAWLYLLAIAKRVHETGGTKVDQACLPKIFAALQKHAEESRVPEVAAAAANFVRLIVEYIEELRPLADRGDFEHTLWSYREKLQRKMTREFGTKPELALIDALLSATTTKKGKGVPKGHFRWGKDPKAPGQAEVDFYLRGPLTKDATITEVVAGILTKALSSPSFGKTVSQSAVLKILQGPVRENGRGIGKITTHDDYLAARDGSISHEEATIFVLSELWGEDAARKAMERLAVAVLVDDSDNEDGGS